MDIGHSSLYRLDVEREKKITYVILMSRANIDPVDVNFPYLYYRHDVEEHDLDHCIKDVKLPQDKSTQEMHDQAVRWSTWIQKKYPENSKLMRDMDYELYFFCRRFAPRSSFSTVKTFLYGLLKEEIRNVYKGSNLYRYGSSVNGFESSSSDLDLTVQLPSDVLNRNQQVLQKLQSTFSENFAMLVESQIVPGSYPILRLVFDVPGHRVDVDLSVNNFKPIFNSRLLLLYSRVDKRVAKLVAVIRRWAKANDLFGGSVRRFNSYALTLLVIHYLQSGVSPPVLPHFPPFYANLQKADVNANLLLMEQSWDELRFEGTCQLSVFQLTVGFMRYYQRYEFEKFRISVCGPGLLSRFNNSTYVPDNAVVVDDPCFGTNPARTVCSETLQRFREATHRFVTAMKCKPNGPGYRSTVNDLKVMLDLEPIAKSPSYAAKAERLLCKYVNAQFVW